MTSGKAKAPRQTPTEGPAPSRSASHTRFKSPIQRAEPPTSPGVHAPSTLPPPPFESEAEVQGLEWWLGAHMHLASDLLCLEQLVEGFAEGGAHPETLRRLTAQAGEVRDALYELYCDAADPRMASVVASGGALEQHVRGRYAWCTRIVAVLTAIADGLRKGGPDWGTIKAGFRDAAECYAGPSDVLRDAVRGLLVDFASPVEPLRNLPQDLEQLFGSAERLHETLASRFADGAPPSMRPS